MAALIVGCVLLTHTSWYAEQGQDKTSSQEKRAGNKQDNGASLADPASVHQSPQRVVGQTQQPKSDSNHSNTQEDPKWAEWPSLFECIMIGLTFFYVLFAAFQWRAIKEQARTSHETVAKMNRAWIAVRMRNPPATTRLPETLAMTAPISIVYSPYNRGNSLARITSLWVKACAFPSEGALPEEPDYWTEPCSVSMRDCEIVVEPGGEMPSPAYVPAGIFRGVYAREKFLHVYGVLTYRDAWEHPHETRFCYCYYVSQGASDVLAEAFYPVGPKTYNKQT